MIRVVAVDDSAVVRSVLRRVLSRDPEITVVGTAPDPFVGRDMIVNLEPDVLLLDLEMPRMDGMTFLGKLMAHRPIPTIIVSSLTAGNTAIMLEALRAGALEVVSKPRGAHTLEEVADTLIEKIKAVAGVHVRVRAPDQGAGPVAVQRAQLASFDNSHSVLALGASTGGTRALEQVIGQLPPNCPGTVVVQHMPEAFTASFAARLNELAALEVLEARDGDMVSPGRVLVAPGGKHMRLKRSGALYRAELNHEAPVNRHRPSVDVLFESVAAVAGRNAVGVIMTGMGDDGARGLLAMRQAGAYTLGQDEATSVVYGMPKAAHELGGVDAQAPLTELAPRAMQHFAAARAKVG